MFMQLPNLLPEAKVKICARNFFLLLLLFLGAMNASRKKEEGSTLGGTHCKFVIFVAHVAGNQRFVASTGWRQRFMGRLPELRTKVTEV